MSRPIPTLGYRSRTEAAAVLSSQGLDDVAIARRMGCTRANVATLRAYVRQLTRTHIDPIGPSWHVRLPKHLKTALAPYAKRRSIRSTDVVRRVLEAALRDGLVDAILDDGR